MYVCFQDSRYKCKPWLVNQTLSCYVCVVWLLYVVIFVIIRPTHKSQTCVGEKHCDRLRVCYLCVLGEEVQKEPSVAGNLRQTNDFPSPLHHSLDKIKYEQSKSSNLAGNYSWFNRPKLWGEN
jgi:hypothetical protein